MGDVDGDDVADIAIVCSNEWDDRARVRIYSGRTGKVLFPSIIARGAVQCVRSIGDLDRDGRPELIIGVAGSVHLFSGRVISTLLELVPTGESASNPPVQSMYGKAIAILRGTDASMIPTIAVSASETDVWGGTLYFHSAKDGTLLSKSIGYDREQIRNAHESDPLCEVHHLGNSLANIGDLDGDDVDDLLCGTRNGEGVVDGAALVYSGRTRELIYELRRSGNEVVFIDRRTKH